MVRFTIVNFFYIMQLISANTFINNSRLKYKILWSVTIINNNLIISQDLE